MTDRKVETLPDSVNHKVETVTHNDGSQTIREYEQNWFSQTTISREEKDPPKEK